MSSYFHGWVYRKFIDPALIPIRKRVGHWVPERSSIIDIGCGTGAQLFALSGLISRGLGVDLSRAQIHHARRQARRMDATHIEFEVADAMRLESVRDGEFDIALSSLAIHEMQLETRLPVLREMRRIGRRLILVDWEAHLPGMWRRLGAHVIERLAGSEHYRGYRSFIANGGIPELLEQASLNVLDEQDTSKGTMRLWLCE